MYLLRFFDSLPDAFAGFPSQTLVYVVDTPRTSNPTTFMSNMLYACSVLYKSRLPLVLALNKVRILLPLGFFLKMCSGCFFSMVAKQSRCTHGFRVVRCLYYHDEVNFLLVLANLGCRRRRRPYPHRPAARRVPARICAPRVSRLGASVPFRNRSRERPRF